MPFACIESYVKLPAAAQLWRKLPASPAAGVEEVKVESLKIKAILISGSLGSCWAPFDSDTVISSMIRPESNTCE